MEELFSYGWPGIRKFFRKNLVSILYTLIFHLAVLIVLVFLKVDKMKQGQELGIQLEFEEQTVEDILEEKEMEIPAEWLEEVMRQREAASNRAVNVNAEDQLTRELSTEEYVQDLLDQIEQARNEEDREKLEELQAILAAADYVPPATEEDDETGDYTGPTTITYEFMEEVADFTVNVLPNDLAEVATYCGTVSGRDEDKFAEKELTLTPGRAVESQIIQECIIHYECKTVHRNDVIPDQLDDLIRASAYAQGDYHRVYFGEIVASYAEEDARRRVSSPDAY